MRKSSFPGWICSVLYLGFSGCNFAPCYESPAPPIPEHWRFVSNEEEPVSVQDSWWEELGDPILNDCIEQAVALNKDVIAAQYRVAEFCARFQVAASPLYPFLDLQILALKQKFPEQVSFLPSNTSPIVPEYGFLFNLRYEIDLWGKYRNQACAGLASARASLEEMRGVLLTVITGVAKTYTKLRQLDSQLEISKRTLRAREEYLAYATLRFEGGLTSEIEVTQASSLLEETAAAVATLEEMIPQQENALSVLLGVDPHPILRGRKIEEWAVPTSIPTDVPSTLLLRRPDIRRAEQWIREANANIGVARAAFFPNISLTGWFGADSFELSQLFQQASSAWGIGGEFTEILFQGGALWGDLKVAYATQGMLWYTYQQVVLQALREVNDALIALQQTKERVAIQESRMQDVGLYLQLSWYRYYNGQTDYLTVLDAERQLYRAQIDWVGAQGDFFEAYIDLYKSLGGGWAYQPPR